MKTLRQLKGNTPADIVANAQKTSVYAIKMAHKKDKHLDTLVIYAKGMHAATDKIEYDLEIELYPSEVHQDVFKRPGLDSPCVVRCTCPYFHYYVRHALMKVGSTVIRNDKFEKGALEPPLITNPRQIPYLCKHLYRASDKVIQATEVYLRRVKEVKFVK